MNSEQSRMALALVLTGIIFFAWQYFFAPPVKTPSQVQSTSTEIPKTNQEIGASAPQITPPAKQQAQTYHLQKGEISVNLDSQLGVKDFKNSQVIKLLEETTGAATSVKVFLSNEPTRGWQEISLEEISTSGEKATGRNSSQGVSVTQFISDSVIVESQITLDASKYVRFELSSAEAKLDPGKIREFILLDKNVERISVGETKDGDLELKWAGIDFNYHIFNVVLSEKAAVKYETTKDGRLILELTQPVKKLNFEYVYTTKNYDHLNKLGDNLELAVDFGMFGILAVPMLHVLQFFYKTIPNYGVAIILLTILLRLLTFPLMWSSFKNMKKMQVIQPELAKIREKYKEDPQRMQKESMDLFKKSGANPLNGCLPMLLQIPFFFAFYKMLNGAIELVGAPFFLWIKDLSLKDPYYVLPVLMTLTFFFQQKMTPNTAMDPMQRKMMLFMPIIFGFIMKDLPSGLTLYIFVSTLFGIAQQYFVGKKTT